MKKLLLFLAALFISSGAQASQNATQLPTSSPYPGLTMLNNINSALNTIISNFSGASVPSSPITYQWWADTTTNIMRVYDGANWLPAGQFSGSQWIALNAGVLQQAPASTGSSNAYVVTYSPAITTLTVGVHYPFIANFQNTTAATENVNGIGAKPIKKQGGVALTSADIVNGAVVDTVWDGTNFQMVSQTGNSASGTVTSVGCGSGLSGGTITTSGSCSLATATTNQLLANPTGGTAVPIGTSLSSFLDSALDNTQGDIIYRNASVWVNLPPGTNGYPLLTGGSGGNISWTQIGVAAISATGTASSSTFLRGDGSWSSAVSLPTALAVGSIIQACFMSYSSAISAGSTTSSSNLQAVYLQSTGSPQTTGDSLSGTWQALQSLPICGSCSCPSTGKIGLFQRTN